MSVNLGKKMLCRVAICIGTALLILATMVAVVESVAFDRGFYEREYDMLGSAEYVGVPRETLDDATEALLNYLEGGRETLDMPAEIDGQLREFYNEREKLHMVDVANLNKSAVMFMWVFSAVGIFFVALGRLVSKDSHLVWKTVFFSIIGVLLAFVLIAMWAAMDFGSFWVKFHHIFFTNDLWMFDPAESLLIRMFEQQFFFDMVGKILAIFMSIVIGALVLTGIMSKKSGNKQLSERA